MPTRLLGMPLGMGAHQLAIQKCMYKKDLRVEILDASASISNEDGPQNGLIRGWLARRPAGELGTSCFNSWQNKYGEK